VTVEPMPPPAAVIALGVDQARHDERAAEVLHILAVTVSPRS
jgi:hypothetical protein